MRLLDRKDTSLAIALVAGALLIFQKPLHMLIDVAHEVELRYNIDLLPGLVVLVGAFAFHAFRKRQQTKAVAEQARALTDLAAAEVAQERQRSAELERLVALGSCAWRRVGYAGAAPGVLAVFPGVRARSRPVGAHADESRLGQPSSRRAARPRFAATDTLESIANEALSAPANGDAQAEGIPVCRRCVLSDGGGRCFAWRCRRAERAADVDCRPSGAWRRRVAPRDCDSQRAASDADAREQRARSAHRLLQPRLRDRVTRQRVAAFAPFGTSVVGDDVRRRPAETDQRRARSSRRRRAAGVGGRSGDGDASCQRHQVPVGRRRVPDHSSRYAALWRRACRRRRSRARSAPSSSRRRQGRCRRRSA